MGKVKILDTIKFDAADVCAEYNGNDLSTVCTVNSKGLLNSLYVNSNDNVQQYIYLDELGAITFTENIYINEFTPKIINSKFKVLLNITQAKLLKTFSNLDNIKVCIELSAQYELSSKIKFIYNSNALNIELTMITQSQQVLDKFPSEKLRQLSNNVRNTSITLDKKEFEKCLTRLMVFDKKFDVTVLNYSKLVFEKDQVKLVSIKNKNYEILKYTSYSNTISHESIIRFADLLNQLKALSDKEIVLNYGDSPAIVINSGNVKQLIPEIQLARNV